MIKLVEIMKQVKIKAICEGCNKVLNVDFCSDGKDGINFKVTLCRKCAEALMNSRAGKRIYDILRPLG